MNSGRKASAHLDKAQEFLDVAALALEVGLHNAAASNAVTSGINAKDAICLKRTGATHKTENHEDATRDLNRAGKDAAALAPTLKRLLSLKAKSQYRSVSASATDARTAVKNAKKMYEAAQSIVRE